MSEASTPGARLRAARRAAGLTAEALGRLASVAAQRKSPINGVRAKKRVVGRARDLNPTPATILLKEQTPEPA